MDIKVDWDDKSLLLKLRNGEKRLAFATVNALNQTAKKVQEEQFANVRSKFHIRMPALFFGTGSQKGGIAAKITQFARVKTGVLAAVVETGKAAAEGKRRILLSQFETGGVKLPGPGRGLVAIPITGTARPSMAQAIDPKYTFANMNLTAYVGKKKVRRPGRRGSRERGYGTRGGSGVPDFALKGVRWVGRGGIFMVMHTRKLAHGGVFEKTGKGRGSVRLLWKFQPSVPIDNRLQFFATAQRAWAKWYKEAFQQEVLKTLAFHKFRFVR